MSSQDGIDSGVPQALSCGLRNFWYPLSRSQDLGTKPVGLKCLGEDLVLWRDSKNRAHLFSDYCAHRAARLSLGQVHGDILQCWYHGIQYDTSGQCCLIPIEGEHSSRAKQLSVRSYPTGERGGLIWGYIGDVDKFAAPPLEVPEELVSDEWQRYVLPVTWNVNWLLYNDNLVDPLHAPYLHARSYTLSRGLRQDKLKVSKTAYGIFVERENQRLVNFDYVEAHFPNWFRVDIPYPWSAGPGGPLHIVVIATPIDEDSTLLFFIRMRKVSGWKRLLWRALWSIFLERMAWNVIEQDRIILESQRGLQSRRREHLVQSDAGVMYFRQLLNLEVARQSAIYNRGQSKPAGDAEITGTSLAQPHRG
jgi:phenylpropionate dioxygenase-like ring-hydroxylating dioxygenase large terminal subunit